MKITLEPRKTTWVPFVDCKAKIEVEWTAKIEYNEWAAHNNSVYPTYMRYIFHIIGATQSIPSSQLIIKEKGVPLAITQTVVTPTKDRFKSEQIADPFVEISDRTASIEKSRVETKQLSKRMIERSWTETIERSIKIENKTGKNVLLKLTVADQPANEIVFAGSTPEPGIKEPPEYTFTIKLAQDAIQLIKVTLKFHKLEKISLPPENLKVSGNNRVAEADDLLAVEDSQNPENANGNDHLTM